MKNINTKNGSDDDDEYDIIESDMYTSSLKKHQLIHQHNITCN